MSAVRLQFPALFSNFEADGPGPDNYSLIPTSSIIQAEESFMKKGVELKARN